MRRQPQFLAAVVGDASAKPADLDVAEALGGAIAQAGLRLITGGLGGMMEAASRGARSSPHHAPGNVVGVLPGYDASRANRFVDVVICTGLGHARNVVVVSSADIVFAVGGKAGTLSEIALAWTLRKPIIAVGEAPGWSTRLAGVAIDSRRRDSVHGPLAPQDAVDLAMELLRRRRRKPGAFQ